MTAGDAATVAPAEPGGLVETMTNSGITTTTTTTIPKQMSATAPGAREMPRKDGDRGDGDGVENGVDGVGGSGGLGDDIATPPRSSPSRRLFGLSLGKRKWWGRGGGGGGRSGNGALSSADTTAFSDFAETVKAAEVSEEVSVLR